MSGSFGREGGAATKKEGPILRFKACFAQGKAPRGGRRTKKPLLWEGGLGGGGHAARKNSAPDARDPDDRFLVDPKGEGRGDQRRGKKGLRFTTPTRLSGESSGAWRRSLIPESQDVMPKSEAERGALPPLRSPFLNLTQHAPGGWSQKSIVRAGPGHWSGALSPLFFCPLFVGQRHSGTRGQRGTVPSKKFSHSGR